MSEENLIDANQPNNEALTKDETPEGASQTAEQVLYPDKETVTENAEVSPKDEETLLSGAPEKYEFTFPEGVTIDTELTGELEQIARESNLTNAQAQKFAELGAKLSAKNAESFATGRAAQISEWEAKSKTDKEFGGDNLTENLGIAKSAMTEFASPELIGLINSSGMGSHPELIRMFYKLGKSISSDRALIKGNAPKPKVTTAESLYGKNK